MRRHPALLVSAHLPVAGGAPSHVPVYSVEEVYAMEHASFLPTMQSAGEQHQWHTELYEFCEAVVNKINGLLSNRTASM